MAPSSGRLWRRLVTAAFVAVLAVPVAIDRDSLPLSRYPMYAVPRPAELTFVVPLGIDAAGNPVDLSTREIAATADPLIAESWLRDALASSRLDVACAEIADRVDDTLIRSISITVETHDVSARAAGEVSLVASVPGATCDVG